MVHIRQLQLEMLHVLVWPRREWFERRWSYRELDEVGERVDRDRLAHTLKQVVQLRRIQRPAAVRVRLDELGLQRLVRDVSTTWS